MISVAGGTIVSQTGLSSVVMGLTLLAIADFACAGGSIYSAVSSDVQFMTAVGILMTGVLLVGFVRRDSRGVANIGIESYLIALIYGIGILVVFLGQVL